ncbi:MAG: hypothetical protein ACPLPR_02165 [Bacillota bacterium]
MAVEDVVLIGIVMVVVEMVKAVSRKWVSEEAVKQVVTPLAVLVLSAALNVVFARVFTPEIPWREALLRGLTLGAVASGIYGLGKAALGKS